MSSTVRFQTISAAVRWLTEPPDTLPPVQKRQARLLMMSALTLIGAGILFESFYSWVTQDFYGISEIIGIIIALAAAHILSRNGYVKLAAILIILMPALGILVMITASDSPMQMIGLLPYILIPLLIGGIFFSSRNLGYLSILFSLGMLSLAIFIPEVKLVDLLVGPIAFLWITTGVIYVSSRHRDALEAEHQAELARSELRFRQMAENIQEAFWTYELSSDRINYVSPAYEKVLGQTRESLYADPSAILKVVHPEDRIDAYIAYKKIGDGNSASVETRIIHPDGSLHWIWSRGFPIVDRQGAVSGMAGIITDITERKQAEEQIQLQLRRMRALSEIDRAIGSSLDMRLSLDILLTELLTQLGVDAASILLLNHFNQTLEYVAGKGFRTLGIRQSSLRLGEGLAGQVGLERKVLHLPNLDEIGGQFQSKELPKDEKFVEYFGIPLIAKGMLKGVLEVFHRTPLTPDLDWLNYLETLGGQAAIAIDNVQMFEGVQQSNLELVTAYDATIEGWSRAMDLRDKETEGHTLRVTELTVQLAKKMGISQQEIVQMRRGALLHDIGKLGVPDNVLLKPDKLSTFEWAVMRQHPSYAYKMLLPIVYLRPALDIPYCHHERWDGTGYPRELKGEDIPVAARIFAIIDVWDALRSDRPYRAGWTIEKIREHIIEESGKHFDPRVVEAFLSLLDESPNLR